MNAHSVTRDIYDGMKYQARCNVLLRKIFRSATHPADAE